MGGPTAVVFRDGPTTPRATRAEEEARPQRTKRRRHREQQAPPTVWFFQSSNTSGCLLVLISGFAGLDCLACRSGQNLYAWTTGMHGASLLLLAVAWKIRTTITSTEDGVSLISCAPLVAVVVGLEFPRRFQRPKRVDLS